MTYEGVMVAILALCDLSFHMKMNRCDFFLEIFSNMTICLWITSLDNQELTAAIRRVRCVSFMDYKPKDIGDRGNPPYSTSRTGATVGEPVALDTRIDQRSTILKASSIPSLGSEVIY
jgi:hypothetical protein